MVGGAETAAAKKPLSPDERSADQARMCKKRDRLLRGDLKSEFEMVLQVLANARSIDDDIDTQRAQFRLRPHARQLQQLRRIDRAAAKNDLTARPRHLLAPITPIADADSTTVIKGNARRERMGDDLEVGSLHGRLEIGVGG